MQKESIATGIGGLILGLVMGLAIPKLLVTHKPAQPQSPESPAVQPQAQPAVPNISQFQQVIQQFVAALQKNPQDIDALLHLGGIYYSTGKFDEAQNYFKKVLEIDPKQVDALVELGNIAYDREQFQPAIEYYGKVLEIKPELTDVRTDMATMYRRAGMPDKAIEELMLAIQQNPNHALSRMNLGIIQYYDKGNSQAAITAWEEFLKRFPNHEQAASVRQMLEEAKKKP